MGEFVSSGVRELKRSEFRNSGDRELASSRGGSFNSAVVLQDLIQQNQMRPLNCHCLRTYPSWRIYRSYPRTCVHLKWTHALQFEIKK